MTSARLFRHISLSRAGAAIYLVQEGKQSPYRACFESFEVNLRSGEVLKNGEKIRLPEQSFRILSMLLERPGEVITRAEIQKRLWPNDTVVEFENSINAAIKRLRLALSDSAEQPRYVETLARRGYRWKISVEWLDSPPTQIAPQVANVEQTDHSASRLLGRKISHYRVLEILGGGGMGLVYKAEDIKLGRGVALKFIPQELADDTAAMQRLQQEARAASALNHPNICTVYSIEEHEGQPFIAMELVEGETLRELMGASGWSLEARTQHSGPLPLEKLVDIGVQIAEALEAAHEKGIIHRDIKPANIMITRSGRVKILDFGLARTQDLEKPDSSRSLDGTNRKTGGNNLLSAVTVSKTAAGTAAYMSPEQIRREALDTRTDLFSFGLVLYEMTSGQRAFAGEDISTVHRAILQQGPAPIRKLNPEVPSQLETIISKAIEKDRDARYQTAVDLKGDLRLFGERFLPRKTTSLRSTFSTVRAKVVVGMCACILMVGLSVKIKYWNSRHEQPAFRQTQLTTNSTENPVSSGAISQDGKYVVYADLLGIHIREIETGETRTSSPPEKFKGHRIDWGIVSPSLPDSSTFLANGWGGVEGEGLSIWAVPLSGGTPHIIRDRAIAESVARDGSWVSFTTDPSVVGDGRKLWVMRPDGTEAHKIYEADENGGFSGGFWSPDGQRLSFVLQEQVGNRVERKLITRDLAGGAAIPAIPVPWDYTWLPDGRMFYSVNEPGPIGASCNLWSRQIQSGTGLPLGQAQRLTNWAGFCMDRLSSDASARRLAFRRWSAEGSIYVAALGTKTSRPSDLRLLTLNEGRNYPVGWTNDGKAVIFQSYQDGHWRIFKQSVSDQTSQPIVTEPSGVTMKDARMTPDGASILYATTLLDDKAAEGGLHSASQTGRQLKRVPLNGGVAQVVLTSTVGFVGPRCAVAPATLCVIAQQIPNSNQISFIAVDPVEGVKGEVARFEGTADSNYLFYLWDLSPDGGSIVLSRYPFAAIQILHLATGKIDKTILKGWNTLRSLNWASDGQGIIGCTDLPSGIALERIDLTGKTQVLFEQPGSFAWNLDFFRWNVDFNDQFGGLSAPMALTSRDGHQLAIYDLKLNTNMWMIEDF